MFYLTTSQTTNAEYIDLYLRKNHVITKNWTLEFFINSNIINTNFTTKVPIFEYMIYEDYSNVFNQSSGIPISMSIKEKSKIYIFNVDKVVTEINSSLFNKEWNHISLVYSYDSSIIFYLNGNLIIGENANNIPNIHKFRTNFYRMRFYALNTANIKIKLSQIQIWTNVKRSGNFTPPELSEPISTTDISPITIDNSNINNLYENNAGYDDVDSAVFIVQNLAEGYQVTEYLPRASIQNVGKKTSNIIGIDIPIVYVNPSMGEIVNDYYGTIDYVVYDSFYFKRYDKHYKLENALGICLEEVEPNKTALLCYHDIANKNTALTLDFFITGNENRYLNGYNAQLKDTLSSMFTNSFFDNIFKQIIDKINLNDGLCYYFDYISITIQYNKEMNAYKCIAHVNGIPQYISTNRSDYPNDFLTIEFKPIKKDYTNDSEYDRNQIIEGGYNSDGFDNFIALSKIRVTESALYSVDPYDVGQELFEEQTVHMNHLGSVLYNPDILMLYPDPKYKNGGGTSTRFGTEGNTFDQVCNVAFSNNAVSSFKLEVDSIINAINIGYAFPSQDWCCSATSHYHHLKGTYEKDSTTSFNYDIVVPEINKNSIYRLSEKYPIISPNIKGSIYRQNTNSSFKAQTLFNNGSEDTKSFYISTTKVMFPIVFRLGKKLINTPHTVEFWAYKYSDQPYSGDFDTFSSTPFFILTTINRMLQLSITASGNISINIQTIDTIYKYQTYNKSLNDWTLTNGDIIYEADKDFTNYSSWFHVSIVYDQILTIYINGLNVFTTTEWDGYIHRLGFSPGYLSWVNDKSFNSIHLEYPIVFFTGIKVMQTANHHANFNTPEELNKV